MASVPSRDSKPELLLRRELHQLGFRYRVHPKDVLGKPDIVNRSRRVAIFVDGDFWHGNAHRLRGLDSLADLFPTNTAWWVRKIEKNVERDETVTTQLETSGWTVIRVWESEVNQNPVGVARSIMDALHMR